MWPVVRVARTASAIIGAVPMGLGVIIGAFVNGAFDGTVRPLTAGFFACGMGELLAITYGERGRLFRLLE